MSLSESISALCEEILRGKDQRTQSIIEIKDETVRLRGEAAKTMSTLHRERMKIEKESREERRRSNRLNVKETRDLLKGFNKEQNGIQRELLEAFGIWRNTFGLKKGVSTPKISRKEKAEESPYREMAPRKTEPTAQEQLFQAIGLAKSLTDKVLTVLRDEENGLTLEEISKLLGISEERLDRVIRRSVGRGSIEKVGRRYRVASS